ncbi:MAG: hypothetical protein V4614_15145 [Pseudomonadota bacterium]
MNPPEYCLFTVQFLCLTSPEWASWVQAFGSVGAIVAATRIASQQHRSAQKLAVELELNKALRRHNAITGIAMHARRQLRFVALQIYPLVNEPGTPITDLTGIERAKLELDAINVSDVELVGVGVGVRNMLWAIREITTVVNTAGSGARISEVWADRTRDIEEVAERALADIKDSAREAAEDPRGVLPP